MTELTHEEMREIAPDLTLGSLTSEERSKALAHLAGCADCRDYTASLQDAVNILLHLAPSASPPRNFENQVLKKTINPRPRISLRLVAAFFAVAMALLVLMVVAQNRKGRFEREYVTALRVLGGKSLQAARLISKSGADSGQVFLYDGHPPWLFTSLLDARAPDGPYRVEIKSSDRTDLIGEMKVSGHRGSFGHTIEMPRSDRLFIVIRDQAGRVWYSARIDRESSS